MFYKTLWRKSLYLIGTTAVRVDCSFRLSWLTEHDILIECLFEVQHYKIYICFPVIATSVIRGSKLILLEEFYYPDLILLCDIINGRKSQFIFKF